MVEKRLPSFSCLFGLDLAFISFSRCKIYIFRVSRVSPRLFWTSVFSNGASFQDAQHLKGRLCNWLHLATSRNWRLLTNTEHFIMVEEPLLTVCIAGKCINYLNRITESITGIFCCQWGLIRGSFARWAMQPASTPRRFPLSAVHQESLEIIPFSVFHSSKVLQGSWYVSGNEWPPSEREMNLPVHCGLQFWSCTVIYVIIAET